MTAHRALAERSRAALLQRFPNLAPALTASTTTKAIVSDGVTIDLAHNGRHFLGGDGRALAEASVTAFLARPTRLLQSFPRPAPTHALENRLLDGLVASCRRLGLDRVGFLGAPPADHGLLIVLGVGIGHHLPVLVGRTAARRLVIVETEGEFLRQSTGAIDWQALFESVEGRGGSVDLFLTDSATPVVATLARTFDGNSAPLLDGTTFYSGYDNPILSETRDRVIAAARQAAAAPRSWEDAHTRLAAALANLQKTRFHLLTPRPRPKRPEPAIILGAGASLESGIEHVKRLRQGAVIFSCGAALDTCQNHGVIPDFHCECDGQGAARSTIAAASLRLSVPLIAPIIVESSLPSLFEACYFAFPEDEPASRLLAKPDLTLKWLGPTSVNVGIAAAAALGFQTLYLFGVDCGARFSGPRFTETAPGNFGGTVATDARFDQSRRHLAALIADRELTVFNCSNGALIDGARPRHGTDVFFAVPRIDRPALHAAIANAHAPWPSDTFLHGLTLAPALAATGAMFDAITALTDTDADVLSLWLRLSALLADADTSTQGLSTLTLDVTRTLIRQTVFFLNRTEAAENRLQLWQDALHTFQAILPEMCAYTNKVLESLPTTA